MVTLQYIVNGNVPTFQKGVRRDRWVASSLKDIEEIGKPVHPIGICKVIKIELFYGYRHTGELNNDHILRQFNVLSMLEDNGIIRYREKNFSRYPNVSVHAKLVGGGEYYTRITIIYDEQYWRNSTIPLKGLPVIVKR